MKTITENATVSSVYTLDQLEPHVRNRVLDRYRYVNTEDPDWHDAVLENRKEKLEELGYSNPKIEYSGFWSQGDGASFTSDSLPSPTEERAPELWAAWRSLWGAWQLLNTEEYPESANPIDAFGGRVTRSSYYHYVHENTVGVDWQLDWDTTMLPDDPLRPFEDAYQLEWNRWADTLNDRVLDLCREIYRDLEKEYEYLSSDENIAEWIEANDLMFDEEGDTL